MRRILAITVLAVVALTGCAGWVPYGPNPQVAFTSMVHRCRSHDGVANWHSVIINPGAQAVHGQDDFACRDGFAGVARWDTQAPGGSNAP